MSCALVACAKYVGIQLAQILGVLFARSCTSGRDVICAGNVTMCPKTRFSNIATFRRIVLFCEHACPHNRFCVFAIVRVPGYDCATRGSLRYEFGYRVLWTARRDRTGYVPQQGIAANRPSRYRVIASVMGESDGELARRLQEEEQLQLSQQQQQIRPGTSVAQSSIPTATLGFLQGQTDQVPFTEEGGALFSWIRAFHPRYFSQRGIDLTGEAMASGVTAAFTQTTQRVRDVDTTTRDGMSFLELMKALTMPGETERARISFDKTSFWEAQNGTGESRKLRKDLINGCAMLTSHRLLFLTLSGGESVHIDGRPIPEFVDPNSHSGGCTAIFDCLCCGERPQPGFYYNVSTTKETGNTFVPIDHKDIQRGISFSVATGYSFAGGVSFRRQVSQQADAACCLPNTDFSYPPTFDQVRNLTNENNRMIELGLRLPPWGDRSTVQIMVARSDKLLDITKFVSKLQEVAVGDAILPANI